VRVYCDSSALIKRVIREPESDALVAALEGHLAAGDSLVSSSLAWIETSRVIRFRLDLDDPGGWSVLAETAMSGIHEGTIDDAVVALARRIGSASLRTLNAIHLASAVLLDSDIMLSYDDRLVAVAEEMGLITSSPR
jgi:hypothetical protein